LNNQFLLSPIGNGYILASMLLRVGSKSPPLGKRRGLLFRWD
jgi:hypothetical protein